MSITRMTSEEADKFAAEFDWSKVPTMTEEEILQQIAKILTWPPIPPAGK